MFGIFSEIGIDHLIAQDFVAGCLSFFVVSFGGIIIGLICAVFIGFVTKFVIFIYLK
jgi:hypothetical protein